MAGGQQQTDPMITWAMLMAMIIGSIYLFWVLSYASTGPALIKLKRMELYPFTFISKEAEAEYRTLTRALRTSVPRVDSSSQMWSMFIEAGRRTGGFYRYPLAAILGGILLYVMFFRKKQVFKTKFSLESLMREHAIRWPVITPMLRFNPSKGKQRSLGSPVPASLPPFAEALYPEEWMAHNRISVVNGVPDRDQIRRAFLPQLCERFEGIDGLPEHLYCLAAALALKGARKRKECDVLLGEMACCWSPERGFVPSAGVKSKAVHALRNSDYADPLLEVMNKHAYVATAFLAALKWARRQGGVLAPAQFVWLRADDRTLWYPLNNLDRRAYHVEAAGAMAHYMAELHAGRPLTVPRLEAAVVSVVQYLSDVRPRIPQIDDGSQKSQPKGAPKRSGGAATLQLAKQS